MISKRFDLTIPIIAAVCLLAAGLFASSARAQGAPSSVLPGSAAESAPGNPAPMPNTYYGAHHKNVEQFGDFLDSNPAIAQDLSKHPRLIRDPNYVNSHPELKSYLESHPQAAKRFEAHPIRFMHREHRYDKSVARYDKRQERKAERHQKKEEKQQ